MLGKDSEKYGSILMGIDMVTNLIGRCALYEELYPGSSRVNAELSRYMPRFLYISSLPSGFILEVQQVRRFPISSAKVVISLSARILSQRPQGCLYPDGELRLWRTPRRNWTRNFDIQITDELLSTVAGNEDCADAMMGVLLGKIPDLEVSLSIVTAAAENKKQGKQVIIRLLSRTDSNRITAEAITAVVGNERWGQEWAEALLNSHPSMEIIGMVLRAVAATPLRIKVIRMLLSSFPQRLCQRVAVILQASALDFEAIVEQSEGETANL